MSKLSCFLLCIVGVSLSSVYITKAQSLRDALRPVIAVCSQEYGVTDADIQATVDTSNPSNLKLCFIACVGKKIGFIDGKGNYNVDSGLKILREYVKDDVQYNNIAAVAKECASVKDKPVTDGTAGCDRGALAAECFLAHQASFII